MPNGLPASPETTLVILLGASKWPKAPDFHASVAFSNSAQDIKQYFMSSFKLPPVNLLDLFNMDKEASELTEEIETFLEERTTIKENRVPPRDLIVYYVGHGGFGELHEYYLAISKTRKDNPLISSLPVNGLAKTLKHKGARYLRRFMLIDSCFAGASTRYFQSSEAVESEATVKTIAAFASETDDIVESAEIPSKGTALLCSSSHKLTSYLAPNEKYTMFSEALLHVLKYGEGTSETYLSIHTITPLIWKYLKKTYGEEAISRPVDDSPNQDEGDIADFKIFPNLFSQNNDAPSPSHLQPSADTLQCYVVGSTADSKRQSGPSLAAEVELALIKYQGDIRHLTQNKIEIKPYSIDINTIISSKEEFDAAIVALCHADVAIFDMTNYEPALMMMLGIRSVVRRGVTILSTRDFTLDNLKETPFNIKESNVISHSSKQLTPYPKDLIGLRILEGIEQLLSLPHYLDLPSFEAIRNIPPDFASQRREKYGKYALALCPFGDIYRENNWQLHLREHLPLFMSESPKDFIIQRTLDINTPRLVSQVLYEAIRFTPMCIVDWTGWKPNVFFELGVRLAVNDINPICIIDHSHLEFVKALIAKNTTTTPPAGSSNEEITRLNNCIDQCQRLLQLFDPIAYRVGGDPDKSAYERMMSYYKDAVNHQMQGDQKDTSFPHHTYKMITENLDLNVEIANKTVYNELIESANMLSSSEIEAKSRWTILYPENSGLKQKAQESANERRLAAWYYIDRRYEKQEILDNPQLAELYTSLGSTCAVFLLASSRETDIKAAKDIEEKIEAFEASMPKENDDELYL